MRQSLRCPKCRHTEILHLPRLMTNSNPQGDLMALETFGWKGGTSYGVVEAYICAECGYTHCALATLLRPSTSAAPAATASCLFMITLLRRGRLVMARDCVAWSTTRR